MSFRKTFLASAAAAGLFLSAPAFAELRVGATVSDPQGGQVGTITAIEGQNLVLRTDKHEVRLPVASFTATDDAVLFALTRDQLNAQVEQALAQAQQAIAVGAILHDRNGAVIGPVEATDAETITVRLGEQQIRLARTAVAPAPNGLVTGATLAELQSQLGDSVASGN
jgi:preprotein translocase subunit YajC